MKPFRVPAACALSALACLLVGCSTGSVSRGNAAQVEQIAFYGHGKLFDREMNEIQPDLTLLTDIQRDLMRRIEPQSFSQKVRASSPVVMEASRLLQSSELRREEELILRGSIIAEYLRDAPEDLRARYAWRNNAIVTAFLNRSRYQLSPRLRDLISRLLDPNEGEDTAYMNYCRDNDVPIPPDWAESGTAWALQGTLTENLLDPGGFAAVWTYTDPARRGGCIALPRGDGSPGTVAGIICQSATTGAACFWDNIRRDPPGPEMAMGWRGQRLVVSQLKDGTNLNSACTDCHRGNNVFNISPDDTTWARVLRRTMAGSQPGTFTTRVESSTDHRDGRPRYIPLTTVPARAGWENTYVGRCGSCHEASPLTRQPSMPPGCATSSTNPSRCYRP
jgi:hypothetical protein